MIKLLKAEELTPEISNKVEALFSQLSQRKQIPVEKLLVGTNPILLACLMENGTVLGMASMCTYKVTSGYKGWIEDVVVDASLRGKGIGEQLIRFLINEGEKMKLSEIYLFTEPTKTAAVRLYTKLGFKEKGSNLYNLRLT